MDTAEFFARTENLWLRMARSFHRKWDLPAYVEPDDVAQQFRLGAMKALEDWDPDRNDISAERFAKMRAWQLVSHWAASVRRGRHGKSSMYELATGEVQPITTPDQYRGACRSEAYERAEKLGVHKLLSEFERTGNYDETAEVLRKQGRSIARRWASQRIREKLLPLV